MTHGSLSRVLGMFTENSGLRSERERGTEPRPLLSHGPTSRVSPIDVCLERNSGDVLSLRTEFFDSTTIRV